MSFTRLKYERIDVGETALYLWIAPFKAVTDHSMKVKDETITSRPKIQPFHFTTFPREFIEHILFLISLHMLNVKALRSLMPPNKRSRCCTDYKKLGV